MPESPKAESSQRVSDRATSGAPSASCDALAPREVRFARLHSGLTRAVQCICPNGLWDHSDDLVQEGILRILRIEQRSTHPTRISRAYLARVARSVCIDAIRRQRVRPGEQPSAWLDPDQNPAGAASEADVRARSREIVRVVDRGLRQLSPDRRTAVELFLRRHSVRTCAEELAWPHKRVENLVYRGLAELRRMLLAEGIHPGALERSGDRVQTFARTEERR